MSLRVALSCVVLVTLSSGCSRTLPFNFSFGSSADGGTADADLAVSHDMAISLDLGMPDLRVSDQGDDQAMPLDDLLATDMVNHVDQSVLIDFASSKSDLRAVDLSSAPDLASVDMRKPPSPIGGPCGTTQQCEDGLFCTSQIPLGSATIEAPGGYCTKECGGDPNECTDAAKCHDFGAKSFCVRGCDSICPTGRNLDEADYGCCSFQEGSAPPVLVGCLPLGIADKNYSCLAVGP